MTLKQKRFFAIAYALVGMVFVAGLAGMLVNPVDGTPHEPGSGETDGGPPGGNDAGGKPVLTVKVRPEGVPAVIYIDGMYYDKTEIEGIPAGKHTLTVQADGYEDVTDTFIMPEGHHTITATMEPVQTASLQIVTQPDQAEIYVDQTRHGRTDTTITGLKPGKHDVRLVKTDYFDHTETVDLDPNETAVLDVKLKSRIVAFLEAQIRENPKVLKNYIDLVHYYIINKNYDRFSYWYAKALICNDRRPSDPDQARRLKQEIDKIKNGKHYYDFDNETIRKLMEAVEDSYVIAAREAPNNPKYRGHLLNAYLDQGKVAEAQQVLEEGLKMFPDDRAWFLAPHGYRNWRTTVGLMQKRLKKNPDNFTALYRMAQLYLYAAEVENAIGAYEKLVTLAKDPEIEVACQNKLGELYERTKNYEKALTAYKAALEGAQDNLKKARQAFTIGVLLQEDLDRLGDAITYYHRAIGYQPDEEMACRWRIELAQLFVSQEQDKEARELLREVLKKSNNERTRQRARRLIENMKSD